VQLKYILSVRRRRDENRRSSPFGGDGVASPHFGIDECVADDPPRIVDTNFSIEENFRSLSWIFVLGFGPVGDGRRGVDDGS
jgi:hypothetical protein